jgi:pimeloyl-ACP methyl ester carboxylesterase
MIKKNNFSLAVLAVALGMTPTVRPAAAQTTATQVPMVCGDYTLSVTLAPGNPNTFHVVGTLCSQGPLAGKTVHLLLHGSTYARYYWDFPYQTTHYSYVRAATSSGYATFNLDRIGNGASDHPDGTLVDMNSNAFVIHQVVNALRAGVFASQSFKKVIVVGHSMGSFAATNYAGTFPGEADGVILTGFLHDVNFDFVNSVLLPSLYPATLDPKFAGQFPNFDYFTSVPGSRGSGFYYMPNTDPQVLALDETLKQTTTIGELNTGPAMPFSPISFQIQGPVQVVIGEFDHIFCGYRVNCSDKDAVQNYEKAFYTASACVETAVISDAGHDLNLQTNAQSAYAKMLSWADRTVGSTVDAPPQPCGAH